MRRLLFTLALLIIGGNTLAYAQPQQKQQAFLALARQYENARVMYIAEEGTPLRSRPASAAPVDSILSRGTAVLAYRPVDTFWHAVTLAGTIGYVSAARLSTKEYEKGVNSQNLAEIQYMNLRFQREQAEDLRVLKTVVFTGTVVLSVIGMLYALRSFEVIGPEYRAADGSGLLWPPPEENRSVGPGFSVSIP